MASPITTSIRHRIVAVVLALAVVAGACSDDGDSVINLGEDDLAPDVEDIEPTPVGSEATTVAYAGLTSDTTSTLADHAGTPLVVNFFAAWCAPCRAEMPDFEAVSQELGDEVQFIGLSVDATRDAAEEIVASTGVSYEVGWDPEFAVYNEFGGFAMPTTALVSADGATLEVVSSSINEATLRGLIDEHLQ